MKTKINICLAIEIKNYNISKCNFLSMVFLVFIFKENLCP